MNSVQPVQLFNTATLKKEPFASLTPGSVGLYTCGPTVYQYAHIGNLRAYVFEDLLSRTLRHAGYKVTHVMNITDVGHLVSDADEGEDKMEKGAAREGKTAWEVARFFENAFLRDVDLLRCLRPEVVCRATDHIAEMISLVEILEKKGFTYRTSDGIYFDTGRFPTYADFARIDVENLQAGHRVSLGEKRLATDFALWKFSPADRKRQMEWPSPWGVGFPGWHIECSAMAMKYLGQTFDIHCGGKDHIRVHHTNEIAQSEAATGKRFARYWMHCEFLIEKSGKMSKSSGEFLTLSRLLEQGFRPMDYRFLLLQAHYRTEVLFSMENLQAARSGLGGIMNRMRDWPKAASEAKSPKALQYQVEFDQAVFDDLNSPIALQVFFDMLKDPSLGAEEKRHLLNRWDNKILGLGIEEEFARQQAAALPPEIQQMMRQRDEARRNKNWAESDRLRKALTDAGYRVEDTPQGTRVIPL